MANPLVFAEEAVKTLFGKAGSMSSQQGPSKRRKKVINIIFYLILSNDMYINVYR